MIQSIESEIQFKIERENFKVQKQKQTFVFWRDLGFVGEKFCKIECWEDLRVLGKLERFCKKESFLIELDRSRIGGGE